MTKQRNDRGRFVVGNSGGPGRPARQTEAEYLTTMVDVCSPKEWRAIVNRAVRDAKAGDPRARRWLGDYLIGPATSERVVLNAAIVSAPEPPPIPPDIAAMTSEEALAELQRILDDARPQARKRQTDAQ